MDAVELLILNHILPSVAGCVLSLVIVLLVLNIFSIKHPALRHAFLLIPLVKPLFILIGGVQWRALDRASDLLSVGIQLPNPIGLIPSIGGPMLRSHGVYVVRPAITDLFSAVIVVALIAATLLFIIRWIGLLMYKKRLAAGERIDKAKYKTILSIVEDLSLRAGVKAPEVIVADTPCPFMIGIKNPVVVLPSEVVEELTQDELEVVLAHEIAHIKRKDNFWLWVAVSCRDLMFFNPTVWLIFELLSIERERAADHLAVKITKKPIDLASSIIKIAEKVNASTLTKPAWAVARNGLVSRGSLERRVSDLLKFKPYKRMALKIVPIAFLFLALSYARITVDIKISEGIFLFFFG
ncbi:MAG TPA: M56 family metallopeptidase [Anaerolineae bacterium]|nr:M56 family metallopeptidase [Anaerolineae bacterium]